MVSPEGTLRLCWLALQRVQSACVLSAPEAFEPLLAGAASPAPLWSAAPPPRVPAGWARAALAQAHCHAPVRTVPLLARVQLERPQELRRTGRSADCVWLQMFKSMVRNQV